MRPAAARATRRARQDAAFALLVLFAITGARPRLASAQEVTPPEASDEGEAVANDSDRAGSDRAPESSEEEPSSRPSEAPAAAGEEPSAGVGVAASEGPTHSTEDSEGAAEASPVSGTAGEDGIGADGTDEAAGSSDAEGPGEGGDATADATAEDTAADGADATTEDGETTAEDDDADDASYQDDSPPPSDGDDLSFDLPWFGRTTFSMTSTSTVRYRGNNYDANLFDDDFFSAYQRFDLALQSDEVRVEARIDGFLPFSLFENRCAASPLGDEDPRCYLDWDLRPERLAVRWVHDEWTVEAGDSQIVLGRGVALSFRKVDLLGVDNALRGGHVRYQGEIFNFRLHGGMANPQNQDPIDLSIIGEPEDWIAAASGGFTTTDDVPFSMNFHALRVWFANEETGALRDRAVDIAGWSVEAPALFDGQLALYAEANGMRRTFNLADTGRTDAGRGVYGSAQLQLDNLTLLVEWKDYTNFLVAPSTTEANPWRIYNAAPSIEYNGPQRLRLIGNQRGGGIRMDYAFLPGPWSFSVNSVAYGLNEEPFLDPWDGVLVTHSWARLAKRQEYGGDLNWSLDIQAGTRFEILLHDHPVAAAVAGDIERWMIHGRAEVTIGSGDHSIDVVVDHRHERELRGAQVTEFEIGGVSATYTFGVPLTLAVNLRWTDFQRGIVEQRALQDYNFLGGEFYPSFEGRWTFEPGTFLALFVGQTPGGQLCSGGVCRDVPTFEGIRLSFVGRL